MDLPIDTELELDQPRDTDWEFEEVFGDVTPKKLIPFPKITIQNQSADPITRMACGQFGLIHIINGQDKIANAINKTPKPEIQAIDCWREILKVNPSAQKDGSTLQSNLDYHRRLGNISGYAKVSTKAQIMATIDANQYIYTGSQNGDWKYVRSNKEYRTLPPGFKAPHITCYCKYDSTFVYGINSYGQNDGIFKVSWDMFLNEFFTKYSVLDVTMSEAIVQYRNR